MIRVRNRPPKKQASQKNRAHESAQIGVMSAWGPTKSRVASSSSTHHPKFIARKFIIRNSHLGDLVGRHINRFLA